MAASQIPMAFMSGHISVALAPLSILFFQPCKFFPTVWSIWNSRVIIFLCWFRFQESGNLAHCQDCCYSMFLFSFFRWPQSRIMKGGSSDQLGKYAVTQTSRDLGVTYSSRHRGSSWEGGSEHCQEIGGTFPHRLLWRRRRRRWREVAGRREKILTKLKRGCLGGNHR